MRKFIVMSDLHIVPEGKLSVALDTAARLQAAVAHINRIHSDAAFCILAGDLTDNGDSVSFARLRDLIAPLKIPVHLTLGNHDDRATALEVLGSGHAADTGYFDRVIPLGDMRVVVLDTLGVGSGAGALDPVQLDWLRAQLDAVRAHPVIIVLHHNIAPLNVPTDTIKLENSAAFADVARAHPDIRQVVSGHVHMSSAGTYRGLPFTTISGNHYNIFPQLYGPLDTVPRLEGPGQIGVVLANTDTVVVHHENCLRQPYGPACALAHLGRLTSAGS